MLKRWWTEFKLFVTSFFFLKNFAMMIGAFFLFILLTNWWLGCYTRHGEVILMENYVGKTIREAERTADKHDFRLEIIDSVWFKNQKPGVITMQDPKPDSPVKKYRTVYLTTSKYEAPKVMLPEFGASGYNFNKYSRKLGGEDIVAVVKERIYDARQADNSIAYFYYKGEKVTDKDVKEIFEVSKGDTLYFVVTERTSNSVTIPNLVCMQYDAAAFLLSGSNLDVGEIHADETVTNQSSAYVWKQVPTFRSRRVVAVGTQVDLYLTQDMPDGCQ